MTMFSIIDYFVFALVCITAIGTAVVAQGTTQDNPDDFISGPDGSCHLDVLTKPLEEGISGSGILFAIQSNAADDDGLMITSFGFHLDYIFMGTQVVEYEVYALIEEGHFADPERDPVLTQQTVNATFDYRGDLTKWNKISEGRISKGNLTKEVTTMDVNQTDFFQIPFGQFNKINVPGNGQLRSFYIATKQNSFIYSTPTEGQMVNDEMTDLILRSDYGYTPKILVGEGVVSYPMPDRPLMYQPKSFMGKVYYEKECPSLAPSTSAVPSAAPTIAASLAPSTSPSMSSAPTSAPSVVASAVPSSMPSLSPSQYFQVMTGGLVLTLPIGCTPAQSFLVETEAVRDSVKAFTEKADPYVSNVVVKVIAFCDEGGGRRLLANPAHQEAIFGHRRLPSSSSALDFSSVITGEYRPPTRPGEDPRLKPLPDVGKIAEDSINRDPVGFVKELAERAGAASPFADVDPTKIKAKSVTVVPGEQPKRVTKPPTKMLTSSPTPLKEDSTNSILLICIVVTAGIIVLLGAFLLFRHGERRAAKNRRRKMARMEEQKEKARLEKRKKRERDETNKHRHAGREDTDKHRIAGRSAPHQYGNPMGYGQPPPPNYYAGAPHQNYSYSHSGPPPPPHPSYGQPYGGQDSHPYPYPQPPPMQSANYSSQLPNNQSNARWK